MYMQTMPERATQPQGSLFVRLVVGIPGIAVHKQGDVYVHIPNGHIYAATHSYNSESFWLALPLNADDSMALSFSYVGFGLNCSTLETPSHGELLHFARAMRNSDEDQPSIQLTPFRMASKDPVEIQGILYVDESRELQARRARSSHMYVWQSLRFVGAGLHHVTIIDNVNQIVGLRSMYLECWDEMYTQNVGMSGRTRCMPDEEDQQVALYEQASFARAYPGYGFYDSSKFAKTSAMRIRTGRWAQTHEVDENNVSRASYAPVKGACALSP